MTNKIRVVLADDHTVLRSGLKMLLHTRDNIEVIGEASSGEEAFELCLRLRPDVLLLDLSMPGMGGLPALKKISQVCPEVRILVLTMHEDEGYLRTVLASGGSGYLLKKAADADLLAAVNSVYRGQVFIDPSLARTLVTEFLYPKKSKAAQDHTGILSEREKEVLRLVAMGYTNRQIAEALTLSVKMVESHKARIKEKLNLQRRSDLVRYAFESGVKFD